MQISSTLLFQGDNPVRFDYVTAKGYALMNTSGNATPLIVASAPRLLNELVLIDQGPDCRLSKLYHLVLLVLNDTSQRYIWRCPVTGEEVETEMFLRWFKEDLKETVKTMMKGVENEPEQEVLEAVEEFLLSKVSLPESLKIRAHEDVKDIEVKIIMRRYLSIFKSITNLIPHVA